MVGNGVSDAAADLGPAMGAGVAIAASDATVVNGDFTVVADAVRLTRATLHAAKGDLF